MAYTRQEISARQYLKKKNNGLCTQCGNTLDRKGLYCSWCVKKINIRSSENRRKLRDMGICPCCRKTKLKDGEKKCVNCREKARIYMKEYYKRKIQNKLN